MFSVVDVMRTEQWPMGFRGNTTPSSQDTAIFLAYQNREGNANFVGGTTLQTSKCNTVTKKDPYIIQPAEADQLGDHGAHLHFAATSGKGVTVLSPLLPSSDHSSALEIAMLCLLLW